MPRPSLIAVAVALALTSSAYGQKLEADTALVAGVSKITGARDWSVRQETGMIVLEAPEGDTRLVMVEVAAADASTATAAAWARYQPSFKRTIKLVTVEQAINGWQEHKATNYETSPSEKAVIYAEAFRDGDNWTVLLLDGSEQTVGKRDAALDLAQQSLRPKNYVPESFAGRTAHPLDAARLQQMHAFLQEAMKTLGVPGLSYALLDHGKIVFEGGLGVRELGKPALVDADTLFMAASNTKGMSTLMLSTLVDEGKLKWDQPVTEVYPAFKLGSAETTKKVQVKHLVCACTGLPRQDLEWIFEFKNATPETSLKLLATNSPTSGFGEVYQYNNLMASAAGYIGGHIAYPNLPLGAAYDEAMQTRLFTPLGMHHTTFDMARALRSNHASPHAYNLDGKVEVLPMNFNYSVVPHRPAGGVWTSAHDLIRYVQLEANLGKLPDGKQLVSTDALLARRQPQVAAGENRSYGMGLSLETAWGVPVVYHGGSMFGYKSDIYLIPGEGTGAVLLTNSDQGRMLLRPMLRRLMEILYDGKPEALASVHNAAERGAAERKEERRSTSLPPDARAVKGLAQHYRSAELGDLSVRRQGKQLLLDFGEWQTAAGTHKNEDGSMYFMTSSAAFSGLELVVGKRSGKRTLTTRDGQHEYIFTER
ncbi:serine hydrolase [Duganella sp. HH101]|uniref:serine hydrolase domain-containing protein n=1 Tax=Duganella sp. HH101 TaxID=1781066 RepID=UPI00089399EA|nr:serine hydrolase domain-containing protein [Duganella sp. HH101]OFA02093.1 esterase EstB [Duganella sp. HH101]